MKRVFVYCAFLLAAPLLGQANTISGMAGLYFWGQKATSYVNGATNTQFWFQLAAVHGRSYCVEAGSVEGPYGDRALDLELSVFQANAITVIANNDDSKEEPYGGVAPRACWTHSALSQAVFVKLFPHSASVPAGIVTLRFIETTLFCPWYFVAGDYNAFSLIRNTSNSDLSGVVVTWRGLNGVVAGTTTVSIPADGTIVLNARNFVNPAVFSNGSVEIAHPGSPEQLQGSTTTLSGTTGLGFDAQFTQRKTW
ncbi:MAG: hypothetical protein ABI592_08515 [Acidobacteriota bacterium]